MVTGRICNCKLCTTSVNNPDLLNFWDVTKNPIKTIKYIEIHMEVINR